MVEKRKDYSPLMEEGYRQIRNIAAEIGLETLDLVPVFENNDPETFQQNKFDELHFNSRGSRLVAEEIANYIQEGLK